MLNKMVVVAGGFSALLSACAIEGAAEEQVGVNTDAVVIASNAFVAHHKTDSLHCASNEVMVGIHLAQGKSICAALNFGYRVQVSVIDNAKGTQVGNPAMHGCPANFFVQGVDLVGPGQDEVLTCVALQTAGSIALTYSSTLQDNHGATQSNIYGITNPKMHACPANFAMVGIHEEQNNLFCAD